MMISNKENVAVLGVRQHFCNIIVNIIMWQGNCIYDIMNYQIIQRRRAIC